MQITLPLPSESGTAGDLARQLATLLGPAYQAVDGTVIAAELLSLGDALGDVRDSLQDALTESFVHLATELLSELESAYGLSQRPDLTTDERRSRLLLKTRAARAGNPRSVTLALAPYDAVTVHENGYSNRGIDGRGVYQWAVQLSVSVEGDLDKRILIQGILEQMKPVYSRVETCTNDPAGGFLVNNSSYLLDRDVLGA